MKTPQSQSATPTGVAPEGGFTANPKTIGVIWAQYGPDHFARFAALAFWAYRIFLDTSSTNQTQVAAKGARRLLVAATRPTVSRLD